MREEFDYEEEDTQPFESSPLVVIYTDATLGLRITEDRNKTGTTVPIDMSWEEIAEYRRGIFIPDVQKPMENFREEYLPFPKTSAYTWKIEQLKKTTGKDYMGTPEWRIDELMSEHYEYDPVWSEEDLVPGDIFSNTKYLKNK